MISKVINDIIDSNVSQCCQRFHMTLLSLFSENHLFNGTKKDQNAYYYLCKDSNPALHTAKRWFLPLHHWPSDWKFNLRSCYIYMKYHHQDQACCKWMPPVLQGSLPTVAVLWPNRYYITWNEIWYHTWWQTDIIYDIIGQFVQS